LDAQHHVVVAQGEGVKVDVERLPVDADELVQSFAWGRHAIAVRDGDREVRARL